MKNFYVTTPIYYANDKPHVGHAYTTVAADVVARYWRQKLGKENVFFLTGTDEHGQKIAEAAEKVGLTPHAFIDSLVPRFEESWRALNISNDIFMRTTKPEHLKFAQEFLKELYANGAIYKGEYVGFYCVGCEEYKTETQLVDPSGTGRAGDKICPLHPKMLPEQRKEENYFFKFKDYASKVRELITAGVLEVLPVERKNEVLSRLDGELHDLSISRPGLSWGIPIPWDETQTMYVWVEALLNYASALEIAELPSFWPPNVQLMSKDILWFHAAIWPALLLAGNREIPKTVFAHGFFTIDGTKMSKTLGNVIDPNDLVVQYGADATRYLLLSAVPFGSDGDLAASRFAEAYASDLANGLGNLLNRTVTLMGRAEIFPPANLGAHIEGVSEAIENLKLDLGLKLIWEAIKAGNQYLESRKPWELVKDPSKREELEAVLTNAHNTLEAIGHSLAPYLPNTSEQILAQLELGKAVALFPRIEDEVN